MRTVLTLLGFLFILELTSFPSDAQARVQVAQHKVNVADMKRSKAGKRFEELRKENADLESAIKVTRGKKSRAVLQEALAENLRQARKLGKALNQVKGRTIYLHGGKVIRGKSRAVARAVQSLIKRPKRYAAGAHLWVNKAGKLKISARAPNPNDIDDGATARRPPPVGAGSKSSGAITGCTPILGQPGTCQ